MPRFWKDVLSPATYHATALDGSRRRVTYSRADVLALAARATAMVGAQRQIPLVWEHQDAPGP